MDQRIVIIRGDITIQQVDIIVNAANTSLLGGGGVDGAIHRAGGPEILSECRKIVARQGGCKTGEAVITPAGKLRAKWVIHTVGPVWNGGKNNEAIKLAACYLHSLEIAVSRDAKSIAFPNISTGIYGYPKEAAAAIALQTINKFLEENSSLQEVRIVCFDGESEQIYLHQIK